VLEPQVNTVQHMATHGEPVTFNDTVRAPVGAFVRGVIAHRAGLPGPLCRPQQRAARLCGCGTLHPTVRGTSSSTRGCTEPSVLMQTRRGCQPAWCFAPAQRWCWVGCSHQACGGTRHACRNPGRRR